MVMVSIDVTILVHPSPRVVEMEPLEFVLSGLASVEFAQDVVVETPGTKLLVPV